MTMKFNKIVPLIADRDPMTFENLVKEIIELKYKFANPQAQSYYFKKGIESQRVRLRKMLSKYNEIRDLINENEISDFQDMIK